MWCPYRGRPQPSNMRSYNRTPLCLACAERLVQTSSSTWEHESAVSGSALSGATDAPPSGPVGPVTVTPFVHDGEQQ